MKRYATILLLGETGTVYTHSSKGMGDRWVVSDVTFGRHTSDEEGFTGYRLGASFLFFLIKFVVLRMSDNIFITWQNFHVSIYT